jgi:hypothetical protein
MKMLLNGMILFFTIKKDEFGALFGIYPLSGINDHDERIDDYEEGLYLYLQFWKEERRGKREVAQARQNIIAATDRAKGRLSGSEIRFDNPWEEEKAPDVLAHWRIDDILNLKRLADDPEEVSRQVVGRAKKFTETLAPELPALNERLK